MKNVYEASTGLDAHMILNLLEMHGIAGRIDGEYLQGGVGELQAIGLVRVMVADEDYSKAKQVIGEWEAAQPPAEQGPEPRPAGNLQFFIAGMIIGAALMYWLLKMASAA
jgi:hypothetical protein